MTEIKLQQEKNSQVYIFFKKKQKILLAFQEYFICFVDFLIVFAVFFPPFCHFINNYVFL